MTLTPEQVRADVAALIHVDPADVDVEADLRDQGLDSVRVMQLVETWRRAGVEGVDFIALAQDQRLVSWWDVLAGLQDEPSQDSVAAQGDTRS